jgi:hypothetical protein
MLFIRFNLLFNTHSPNIFGYGFRKFVITNMIRAKLDSISREMLVGHDTGLDRCYYRPGTDELLQEYLKVVGLVTISQENRFKARESENHAA